MAKGQHLSKHQQGIVKRYYEHRDTILTTRLAELVSELYMAEGKKADALWKRVEKALAGLGEGVKAAEAERILERRDLEGLARLVGELA